MPVFDPSPAPTQVRHGAPTLKGMFLGALIVLVAVFAVFVVSGGATSWWYFHMRGGDMAGVCNERRRKMEAAGESLERFRSENGRLPLTLDEWSLFDSRATEYLSAPNWSLRGDYATNFDRDETDREYMLLKDPGIDWPGIPAEYAATPARLHMSRVGLTSELRVVNYGWEDDHVVVRIYPAGDWNPGEALDVDLN